MHLLRRIVPFTVVAVLLLAAPAFGDHNPNHPSNEQSDHNGDGEPGNRPEDGSVGNADDQDPKGQGSNDPNSGYECDDNYGVGKGNPAHTGCTTTTRGGTTPTTVGNSPTTTVVSGNTTTTTTAAQPTTIVEIGQPLAIQASPAPRAVEGASVTQLARTGTALNVLAVLGLVLLGVGFLLVRSVRQT